MYGIWTLSCVFFFNLFFFFEERGTLHLFLLASVFFFLVIGDEDDGSVGNAKGVFMIGERTELGTSGE